MVGHLIKRGDRIVYRIGGEDHNGTVVNSLIGLTCNDLLVSEIVDHAEEVLIVEAASYKHDTVFIELDQKV